MDKLNEDKLEEIVIDLGELKGDKLNEFSMLRLYGFWFEKALRVAMGEPLIGPPGPPIKFRGTKSDINILARTLGKERKYLESAKEAGLTSRETYNNKSILQRAVKTFEKKTGIKWPFK